MILTRKFRYCRDARQWVSRINPDQSRPLPVVIGIILLTHLSRSVACQRYVGRVEYAVGCFNKQSTHWECMKPPEHSFLPSLAEPVYEVQYRQSIKRETNGRPNLHRDHSSHDSKWSIMKSWCRAYERSDTLYSVGWSTIEVTMMQKWRGVDEVESRPLAHLSKALEYSVGDCSWTGVFDSFG